MSKNVDMKWWNMSLICRNIQCQQIWLAAERVGQYQYNVQHYSHSLSLSSALPCLCSLPVLHQSHHVGAFLVQRECVWCHQNALKTLLYWLKSKHSISQHYKWINCNELTNIIEKIICKFLKTSKNSNRKKSLPWLNASIRQLMKQRDLALKATLKSRTNTAMALYKGLQNRVIK